MNTPEKMQKKVNTAQTSRNSVLAASTRARDSKHAKPLSARFTLVIISSLMVMGSFWLTWIKAFGEPVTGSDILRMLSYFCKAGNALRIPRLALAGPCAGLLLGFLGILWSYIAHRYRAKWAFNILMALVAVLSGAIVFSATWLVSIMVFPSALGIGFWLGYLGSASLLSIALVSVFERLEGLRDFVVYLLVRSVAVVFRALPRRAAIRLGEGVAAFVLTLLRKRRQIALRNLGLVFGDAMSVSQKKEIIRKSFSSLGRQVGELVHLAELVTTPVEELFSFENIEAVREATADGKGLILLTGHFGCWELSQLGMTKAGFPLTALARPLDNRFLDRWVGRMRSMTGSTIIARRHSLRRIVSELKAGKIVAILFDQNVHRKECVFARLCGMNVASSPLPAVLSRLTGADVIFGAGVPSPGLRYKLIFSDRIPNQACEDYEEFLTVNTSAYNAVFERFIREYPDAWLWVHDRFKDTQERPGFWNKRRAKREGFQAPDEVSARSPAKSGT